MRKKAFTLIEVCVAMMVMFLFIFALSSAFKTSASFFMRSDEKLRRVFALGSSAERIYAMPLTQITSLDGTSFCNGQGLIRVSTVEGFYAVELSMPGIYNSQPAKINFLRRNP